MRRRRWRSAAGWLPVALLLVGFASHLWLVRNLQLSPWLGAGFGMFASTDTGSVRQVFLILKLVDGSDFYIDLQDSYRDSLERARGLPSPFWFERLAADALRAVAETPDLDLPARPEKLVIEIWRNRYIRETLYTHSEKLTSAEFPISG